MKWHDVKRGAAANLPVAASVAAYGSVLGVLASQRGIGLGTLLAMNLSVFAGSAQFVMVDMWMPPLPVLEIIAAVWIINLRYLLIGASLEPLFRGKALSRKALLMHLVADENWAVTMAEHRRNRANTGFLFGGGLCLITFWCGGTLTGHGMGAAVKDPAAFALDFAFVAVFTALAVSLWRGRSDWLPWAVAAVCAVASEQLLPGKWYVVVGGIMGALTALRTPRNRVAGAKSPEPSETVGSGVPHEF